jgi:hypothetical protein
LLGNELHHLTTYSNTFDPSKDLDENKISTLILIRRAGVKGKTVAATTLGSEEAVLYVIENGESYELYSRDDIGDAADPYKVEFYTLQKNNTGVYNWAKDASIEAVSGWSNADEEAIAFPAITGAKFYAYDGSAVGVEYTAGAAGKYTITVAAEIKVAVDKPVTVTYDLNKPENVTSTAVAPEAATTEKGKITPAAVTSLTGTVTVTVDGEETTQNWKVTGWYLDKECETAVTDETLYGEATTIYAKWEKVTE